MSDLCVFNMVITLGDIRHQLITGLIGMSDSERHYSAQMLKILIDLASWGNHHGQIDTEIWVGISTQFCNQQMIARGLLPVALLIPFLDSEWVSEVKKILDGL